MTGMHWLFSLFSQPQISLEQKLAVRTSFCSGLDDPVYSVRRLDIIVACKRPPLS